MHETARGYSALLPVVAGQEDALLRGGLVLAGANNPELNPADDGYLTAAEATGMDLEGTELVTLSACETGLGDVRSGEGVYGLQRAFTVAGSRSTLLSLWKVNDAATAAFMADYYSRLRAGLGRSEALVATQAAFRSHPEPLYREMYVWGAFQLTGDWQPIQQRPSERAMPPK
jgi:CHAT domain-containing protein